MPTKRKTALKYELLIRAPVNGRVGKATFLFKHKTGAKKGNTAHSDTADVKSERDRAGLVRRAAKKLKVPEAKLLGQVDEECNRFLDDALRQQELAAAGSPEAAPKGESGEERVSAATLLVRLVEQSGATFFHSPDGTGYARIKADDHYEVWPLRHSGFRRYLKRLFYDTTNKTPGSQAVEDALGVLDGRACFDGLEQAVHVRLAEHDGRIYLDLGDAAWRAVEIDAEGWRIVEEPPVRFRRPKGLLPLPEPVRGGRLDEMRPFLNLAAGDAGDAGDAPGHSDSWMLLIGWQTAAMRPRGPYPLLVLTGEQGSAKSTAGRVLRSPVDPSVTPLRSEPREVRDLMIAATSGWLVALDNLSSLQQWLSDALCRLSTGGGFATRELYTDAEEVLFEAMRPVLLTSIEEVVTAGDLLDRALFIRLEPIPEDRRRTETELWAAWEKVYPRVLAGLLDAVSAGLRHLPAVRLDRLPRMADFAVWLEAVGRGQGWPEGAALNAYRATIGDAAALALEASLVAAPLLQFCQGNPCWEGTASDLLQALNGIAGDRAKAKGWPSKPHHLSGHLRRLAPNLRRVGVWVTFGRDKRARAVRLESRGAAASPASPAAPEGGVGDTGDAGDAPSHPDSCDGWNEDGSWGEDIKTPFDPDGDGGEERL
jgi:hypothetical protein